MKDIVLTQEQFHQIYSNLSLKDNINEDVLYISYQSAFESAQKLNEQKILEKYIPINHIVLILYLTYEIDYYQKVHNKKLVIDERDILQAILSIALDKYLTNEHYSFKANQGINKFSPVVSTLDLYLNFSLKTMDKFPTNIPEKTLIIDILKKALLMSKAIVDLIVQGFETEAFATWRTLHESECILILLSSKGHNVYESYIKHMKYALAYRGAITDEKKTDEVFVDIKKEMKDHLLKSKDMKKFIEYGWLYSIDKDARLNFRDGVEKLANLTEYSSVYEMASEIAHSSPILIYSKSDYFLHLALLNVYETLFRIDKIFVALFKTLLNEPVAKQIIIVRQIYLNELKNIYSNVLSPKNKRK